MIFTQKGIAQEVSDYSSLSTEEYTNITLPPLSLLFENAKSTPNYQLSQVKEQIERKLLTKEKRSFLSFFSIRGSYQYGMFGNESTYTDVSIPPYLSYSTQAQNGYTIGGAIMIPLDQLLDLGGKVKRQRFNTKVAELEKEVKFEEIKKEIISLYASATSQLNVLKLRVESLVLAKVQYEIAEKDFANGNIQSSELSSEKERYSLALERFENTKFQLTRDLMILEVVSNTSILRK